MKKKIIFFLIFFLFNISKDLKCNDIYQSIQPEASSAKDLNKNLKLGSFKNFVVITANDYSSKIGYEILKKGGTVADAAVAIQLTLGLVEPQSSGLGGGIFLTYFDNKTKKIISFEGREKAPKNFKENIFLSDNGKPKKFFDAVVGGLSVGVPSTLKTLYMFHSLYGVLEWSEVVEPVIELSSNGFIPPNRLISALKKEKFLFSIYPDIIFKKINENPKQRFVNFNYTKTLREISKDISIFYRKNIANDIVSAVNKSKSPGTLNLDDLKNYSPVKQAALCHRLKNKFKICGPNLPSSGTISILQALILYEFYSKKKRLDLNDILEILNFIYSIRDSKLADPDYVDIDINKLLDQNYIVKSFEKFNKSKNISLIDNFQEVFSSTSHFTLVDRYENVLSATSSIESSFGSRLYTNGFFLNNQLTDFSFKIIDKTGELIKNRPQAGKRPLSSMSPLIVFDQNDNFILTLGSPGGKAIISYVFKSLLSVFYMNESIQEAIEKANYIKIRNNTFVETDSLKKDLKDKALKRNLTSGLAIIRKYKNTFEAASDSRRDGTVRGN